MKADARTVVCFLMAAFMTEVTISLTADATPFSIRRRLSLSRDTLDLDNPERLPLFELARAVDDPLGRGGPVVLLELSRWGEGLSSARSCHSRVQSASGTRLDAELDLLSPEGVEGTPDSPPEGRGCGGEKERKTPDASVSSAERR